MDSLCCCWLEIWFGLHCAAMYVWRYGLDCTVLLCMLHSLVCTALCCYGCENIRFGSSVSMLWICYGLLCAAINVGESGLECFELVRKFGYLAWTALGVSQNHFMFEDITDLPFIKTVQATILQFKHEFVL